MDEFFKQIKKSVNNLPSSDATSDDWASFNTFRNQKVSENKKTTPWSLYALTVLSLLLIVSNLIWYKSSESIISQNLIHEIDTIYLTQYKEVNNDHLIKKIQILETKINKISSEQTQDKNANIKLNELLLLKNSLYLNLQSQYNALVTSNQNNLQYHNNNESVEHLNAIRSGLLQEQDISKIDLVNQIQTLKLDPLTSKQKRYFVINDIIKTDPKASKNFLELLKPKAFDLNFNIGTSLKFSDNNETTNGFASALNTTFLFSKKIRGYLGFNFSYHNKEIQYNPANSTPPQISIPENDKIKEVKSKIKTLGLNLGIEYLFYTNTKWRPYTGIGYFQSLIHSSKYGFEIISPYGEYYITPESSYKQNNFSQAIITIGTDYNLKQNFNLRFGLDYYVPMTTFAFKEIRLSLGAYYHF